MKTTTPAQVNKALKKLGIGGSIVRNQQGGCYYYFIGVLFDVVPSIYSYNLDGKSTDDIIEHVQEHYKAPDKYEAFQKAYDYLRDLEAKEPKLFERGSLTDGHQFEKSNKLLLVANGIKDATDKPAWADEAMINAMVVDNYYNTFKEWE